MLSYNIIDSQQKNNSVYQFIFLLIDNTWVFEQPSNSLSSQNSFFSFSLCFLSTSAFFLCLSGFLICSETSTCKFKQRIIRYKWISVNNVYNANFLRTNLCLFAICFPCYFLIRFGLVTPLKRTCCDQEYTRKIKFQ